MPRPFHIPLADVVTRSARLIFRFQVVEEATITIRVQLGSMPTMLGDIVAQLIAEFPDVEIVGRSSSGSANDDALTDAKLHIADLLIVQDGQGCVGQVLTNQGLSILSISQDGREADIVRLDGERLTLDGTSPRRIAAKVRSGRH